MEPIIYKFPKHVNKPLAISESDFIFDTEPSPKLIKYGFNQTVEKLDIAMITSNKYYPTGLNFDFDRTDPLSISFKCKKIFGLGKNINPKSFCICWEILRLFGILGTTKLSVLTNDPSLSEIEDAYQKLFKSKPKIAPVKTNANLVFQTYSQIDLDENAWVHLLLADLPNLLSGQSKSSTMIIQMFGTYTQITVELIYYLSTFYQEAYLMKPQVVSNLSDEKYLILQEFIFEPKLKFPKQNPHTYLSHLNIGPIPDPFINVIQCMNSNLIPSKFTTYHQIKTYLDSNVFEGIVYDEMIHKQNLHTDTWIDLFKQKKLEDILESSIKKTDGDCDHVAEWNNLFI